MVTVEQPSTDLNFEGKIDELMIWNRSLTDEEMFKVFNGSTLNVLEATESQIIENGSNVFNQFNLSTDESTRLILQYDMGGVDYTPTLQNFTMTLDENHYPQIYFIDNTPIDGDNFSELPTNVTINISIEETQIAEIVYDWNNTNISYLDENLIIGMNFEHLHSLFEDTNEVRDFSIYENDGTVTASTITLTEGRYGNAYNFSANDIIIQSDSSLDGMERVTVSVWIQTTQVQGSTGIISHADTGSPYEGFKLGMDTDTRDAYLWCGGASGYSNAVYGTAELMTENGTIS